MAKMVAQCHAAKQHLEPLTTHRHNRSLSSLSAVSDTITFHSAHAHQQNMESRQPHSTPQSLTIPPFSHDSFHTPFRASKPMGVNMARQDGGYVEAPASDSSQRTSTSSAHSRRRSPSTTARPKRRRITTNTGSSTSSTRSTPKRGSRSSRPLLSSGYASSHNAQRSYQYLHFSFLSTPSPDAAPASPPPPPTPPPATVQYWTSDSTRRLEYAAIDAASRGVRGFLIKIAPDCMLPEDYKRTRFCEGDDDDAGSVRRYRLKLPEDVDEKAGGKGCACSWLKGTTMRTVLRRWMAFGRRGRKEC